MKNSKITYLFISFSLFGFCKTALSMNTLQNTSINQSKNRAIQILQTLQFIKRYENQEAQS